MASMSGEVINSLASSVTKTAGYAFSAFRRDTGLLSQIATNSVSSSKSRLRMTFGPQ